jgi:hypothetical protein
MKTKIITIIVLLSGARFGFAQGFVNLDFNSANIPSGTPPSFVPTSEAIPGWTAYLGNNPQASVYYDSLAIGSVNISILDGNSIAGGPIPGNNYTVVLQAGNGGGSGGAPNTTASIAQTAMVPPTAESIMFTASLPFGPGWQVTINGQPISVSQIGSINSYYGVFAGNISAYAGQVDQLEFTALYGPYGNNSDVAENLYLDNIQFSASPVPEPNSFGLFALGGLFVAWLHWRKSSA